MMEGILTTRDVMRMATTPPIRARGRFRRITPAKVPLLNSWNRMTKMTMMARREVINRVLDALCALSNCPPYWILYPSGSSI